MVTETETKLESVMNIINIKQFKTHVKVGNQSAEKMFIFDNANNFGGIGRKLIYFFLWVEYIFFNYFFPQK